MSCPEAVHDGWSEFPRAATEQHHRTIQEADQDGDGAVLLAKFVRVLEKVGIEQKVSIQFLD